MTDRIPADLVAWPALPLEEWRPTKATLHRYCQMVGKVRLTLTPFSNHWWHVTPYVTVDGLTTGPFPVGDGRQAEVRLDFREHAVRIIDSAGAQRSFELRDRFACAHFHDELVAALADRETRLPWPSVRVRRPHGGSSVS